LSHAESYESDGKKEGILMSREGREGSEAIESDAE